MIYLSVILYLLGATLAYAVLIGVEYSGNVRFHRYQTVLWTLFWPGYWTLTLLYMAYVKSRKRS